MGLGSQLAGASIKGVWNNALGLWPLAAAIVLLDLLHDMVSLAVGGPEAALQMALASKGLATLSGQSTAVLVGLAVLGAMQRAFLISLGLILWTSGGGTFGFPEAWRNSARRLPAVMGTGAVITLVWFLPEMLGILAIASGRGLAGGLLLLLGFAALIYIAGRRYLAMPIALYEDKAIWASLKGSHARMVGHRKSVAMAVLLLVLVLLPLNILALWLVPGIQAALAAWPTWQAAVPYMWTTVVAFFDVALLSRLAWQVYQVLGRSPSPASARPAATGIPANL